MKIISKYKDYYDYLVGIYGEDPKIVLDRRDFSKQELGNEAHFKIFICGKVVEGVWKNNQFYYRNDIKNIGKQHKYFSWLHSIDKVVTIKINDKITNVRYDVYEDGENFNIKYNCPILCETNYGGIERFPILKDINFHKVFNSQEIYKMISDWLSDRITEKELTSDNISNEQKILNKGFDLKTSFRPKMK